MVPAVTGLTTTFEAERSWNRELPVPVFSKQWSQRVYLPERSSWVFSQTMTRSSSLYAP